MSAAESRSGRSLVGGDPSERYRLQKTATDLAREIVALDDERRRIRRRICNGETNGTVVRQLGRTQIRIEAKFVQMQAALEDHAIEVDR